MKDARLFQYINELSAEEEGLFARAADGSGLSRAEIERLEEIKVELDQGYDLLHQRQARRALAPRPESIAQEEMVAAPTDRDELRPGRIGQAEGDAFDEPEPLELLVSTGDLGSDRQEELVEQVGPEQVTDQVRAPLAEDQPGTDRAGYVDELRRRDAMPCSGDLDRRVGGQAGGRPPRAVATIVVGWAALIPSVARHWA